MNALMVQTIVMLMLNVQTILVASVVNAIMDIVEMVFIAKVYSIPTPSHSHIIYTS